MPTGTAIYVRQVASASRSCASTSIVPGDPIDSGSDIIRTFASMLVPVCEQRVFQRLLAAMSTPFAIDSSIEEFLEPLAEFARIATGAGFLLLRKRMLGELKCVAVNGLGDVGDHRAWDLSPIEEYPLLSQVLDGGVPLVPGRSEVSTPEMLRNRYPDFDETVVLPVQVAGEIWGTLSLGLRVKPTGGEIHGFTAVACIVGLALAARSNRAMLDEQHRVDKDLATLAMEVELENSLRHEVKNRLENVQARLHHLYRELRDTPTAEKVGHISEELLAVDRAFAKHSFARSSAEHEECSLRQIWMQAVQVLEGRAKSLNIRIRYNGPDVTVAISPEHLMQVILNLLLNSIKAFRHTKLHRRGIALRLREPAPKAENLSMIYSDTAGGIDRSAMVVPMSLREMPLEQLIFEPRVTSKGDGTGYGLWLVRQILSGWHGSIDLLSHREGAAFMIQLPHRNT